MQRLWSFIFVLAIAIGVGVLIRQDPGYALFSYGEWTVEMPLWLSAVILVFCFGLLLLTVWMIYILFSGSHQVKLWWKTHQAQTARLQTYRGLLALEEGQWKNAERYLSKSAASSDTPLINYLSAAKAAEERGALDRRNQYLQKALEASAGSEVAVRITQAQLQMKHGELEQSIGNLQRLYQESPKHPKVLRLLSTLYEATEDWSALYALLPNIRKTEALPKHAIDRLEQKIYPALLVQYAQKSPRALRVFFDQSPGPLKRYAPFVRDYAKLLIELSENDEAESVLRSTIKHVWSEDLIYLYGLTKSSHPKKALSFAESLLPHHYKSHALQLCIGRLCLQNQLWGRAQDHMEKSLATQPLPETYAELGKLMEQIGQPKKREEYFQKGLLLATSMQASFPHIQEKKTDQTVRFLGSHPQDPTQK